MSRTTNCQSSWIWASIWNHSDSSVIAVKVDLSQAIIPPLLQKPKQLSSKYLLYCSVPFSWRFWCSQKKTFLIADAHARYDLEIFIRLKKIKIEYRIPIMYYEKSRNRINDLEKLKPPLPAMYHPKKILWILEVILLYDTMFPFVSLLVRQAARRDLWVVLRRNWWLFVEYTLNNIIHIRSNSITIK